MHCTQAASSRIQGKEYDLSTPWNTVKKMLTSIWIKTQAEIDFVSGRPQIGQDLTSDSCGSSQSYPDQKYSKNRFALNTADRGQQLQQNKGSTYTTACDKWKCIFFWNFIFRQGLWHINQWSTNASSPLKINPASSIICDAWTRKKWNAMSSQHMTAHHTNTHGLDHNFSLNVYICIDA